MIENKNTVEVTEHILPEISAGEQLYGDVQELVSEQGQATYRQQLENELDDSVMRHISHAHEMYMAYGKASREAKDGVVAREYDTKSSFMRQKTEKIFGKDAWLRYEQIGRAHV